MTTTTEHLSISKLLDESIIQIGDILQICKQKSQDGNYGRQENIEYAGEVTRIAEKLAGIEKREEGMSLNDTFSTVLWLPDNMTHPFSMLKNISLLNNQLLMLKDINWNDTRFVYLYGSRRGSKSFAAVLAFLYAIKWRWDQKMLSGQISPGWIDYEGRGGHEGFLECAIIAPKEKLLTKTLQYLNAILTLSKLNRMKDYDITNKKEGIYLKGGIRIYTVTAGNESGIMGKGLDVVLCTELARLEETIYKQTIRPSLIDKQGIFISDTTIKKGDNWYIDLIKSGISEQSTAWEKNHEEFKKESCKRPYAKTFFFHVRDNKFIPNIEQELKLLKGTEKEKGELPPYLYDQEIEGLWELSTEAIYEEFDESKHVEQPTEEIIALTLNNAEYVGLALDIGYSANRENEGKTALLAIAYSDQPKDLESTDYCILESFESNQVPFLDPFWAELMKSYISKYNAKSIVFDNANAKTVETFKRNYSLQRGLKWIPAIKDIVEGIEHLKQLFHLDKIHTFSEGNTELIEDLKRYRWGKKKNGGLILKPMAAYSDLPDALRYAIYTPFVMNLGSRFRKQHAR